MKGKYIVIEGSDGTGKSTQVDVLQQRLKKLGIASIQVHEPDGFGGDENLKLPPVTGAIELRKIIKNGTIERDAWSNVLLFTAARRLNWQQAMQPALEKGIWVLAARSWVSTVVYQGYGEGIPIKEIRSRTLQDVGETYIHPDIELILTLNNETVRKGRIDNRGALDAPDTFESKDDVFQLAVQDGYDTYAKTNGISTIDASNSIEEISKAIWQYIEPLTRRK